MWLKIDGRYGEYEWRCADTGKAIVKAGITIHGQRKNLHYFDEKGAKHNIDLVNVKTGEKIDSVTNKKK